MKKKITAVALIVALLAIALIGGTLAYFTDTDEATNVFTMGNVDIKLDEAKVIKNTNNNTYVAESERVTENTYEAIYPGATLPKDPTVYNVGSEAAYVRVKVTVENGITMLPMYAKDDTLTDDLYNDCFLAMINDSLGDEWEITDGIDAADAMEAVFSSETDATFVISYKGTMAANTESVVFKEIIIPADWTQDDARLQSIQNTGFKVNVVAEAIQVQGFTNAEVAWAAFDAE